MLAQIVYIASREELVREGARVYQSMLASGVKDSDIRNGSLVFGRVECCGGPNEKASAMFLYVPSDATPALGDIVEIIVGQEPSDGRQGTPNTVTGVRQKANDPTGGCRWDPPDDRLWMRILYCEWMPAEGWVELKATLTHKWVKPPT
jgi:hypothetical protein